MLGGGGEWKSTFATCSTKRKLETFQSFMEKHMSIVGFTTALLQVRNSEYDGEIIASRLVNVPIFRL